MSLYKPEKEHTINFIYCWAALHPDPSRGPAPYSQKLGDVSGVWPHEYAPSTGLKHSCTREGAPGLEWACRALCLSSWPHRAGSLSPGFSPPHTSQEGKPLPSWLETHPKPPHPSTPTSQATGRQGAKVTRASLDWLGQVYAPHFTLTLDSLLRQGSQFPSQELAPERRTFTSAHLSSLYHHHRSC